LAHRGAVTSLLGMTGAIADPAQQGPRRYVRHRRTVPKGEATKVIMALVLNAILFGMLVF